MRVLVVLSAVAAALAIAPSASPGGWATVGFEPLPDGTSAGGTWSPTIFVKQHGVTPLAGLTPVVEIYDDETGAATRFTATETSEAGVYTADVVFPAEGDWRVDDPQWLRRLAGLVRARRDRPAGRVTAARASFRSSGWVSSLSPCSVVRCSSAHVASDG